MGFEVVYCFKCQKRLSEVDFQKGEAFRIGATTTCRKCSPELIAALPAEQQAALLSGPAQVRSTPQAIQQEKPPQHESDRLRRSPTEPPTPRHATAAHTKHYPEMKPAASPVVYVIVGAVIALGLVLFLVLGGGSPRADKDPAAPAVPPVVADSGGAGMPAPARANEGRPVGPPSSVPDGNPRRMQEAEESLRAAREHRKANPNDLEGIVRRFQVALWDAERTPLYEEAKREREEAARRLAATAPKPVPPADPAAAPAPSTGAVAAQPPPTLVAPVLTAADLAAKEEVLRRGHEEAVRKALDDFKAATAAAPDAVARAAAVERLGKAETDPRIAAEMLRHLDGDVSVLRSALGALAPYCGDEKVARAQWKAIQADPEQLEKNLWTLFGCGHPSLVPVVIPYLRHSSASVADAAVWVLDSVFCAESVDGLLAAWEELESARQGGGKAKGDAETRLNQLYWLAPAVARLTGQGFKTPAEYRAWWSKARPSYKPALAPRPAPVCIRHQVPACEVWTGLRDFKGDLASGGWLRRPPDRAHVLRELESPYCLEEYYAARVRGYLVPPVDGDYRFWIAADDKGELHLSLDETPAAKAVVAKAVDFNYARAWDPHPDQVSRTIPLKAGRRYYFEAHLGETKGMDIVSVAWQPPGGKRTVIPGRHLIPFDCAEPDPAAAVSALAKPLSGNGAAPLPVPAPAPPSQGLIGWWRFDESAGDVAEDASGNGRAARLVGAVSRTLGKLGRGVRFAGDGGHVELPSVPDLDGVQGGSYTLAAWFRPEAMPEAGVPSGERFAILVKAGRHLGLAYNHEQRFVAEHWPVSGPSLVAGAWESVCPPWAFHHVAVAVNRTAGEMRFYLDGGQAFVKPLPPEAGAADYGTTPWRIGVADPAGSARRWAAKGVVDDVRIYGRALQTGEIADLLKGPPPEAAAAAAPKQAPSPAPAPKPEAAHAPAPVPEKKPGVGVARLVLVDASTAREIFPLKDGMTFRLSALPTRKLTVRADTQPSVVGSVVMELDGRDRQVEGSAPYSLFGDDKGKHKAGTLSIGEHVISVTPYAEKEGKGEAGKSLSIRFTVAE